MRSVTIIALFICGLSTAYGCKTHQPPARPQSFIGTVGQGCTPKVITQVTQLITDPLKCDLPLGGAGCNLCGLRLYKPEKTTSRFLVQPLTKDFSTEVKPHVEATECKCSDGCYFHKASITQLGIEPLPVDIFGVKGSFSEPFACYSGISMPTVSSAPSYTYLIWCETDGGCPNPVVARYLFFARLELLSPNRPAVSSNFIPKITTLPPSKCLADQLPAGVRAFISGTGGATAPPTTTARAGAKLECQSCKKGNQCKSRFCVSRRCVLSRRERDVRRCFPSPTPSPAVGGSCAAAKRIASCVSACMAGP